MERKAYQPGTPSTRRKEWVELQNGWVCVWELTLADVAQILERTTRPKIDPRGGQDPAAMMLYQIMLSCYDGDEEGSVVADSAGNVTARGPKAQRVFSDSRLPEIGAFTLEEMEKLIGAVNRTCGKDAEEELLLKDFTKATGALNTSE